VFDRDNGPFCRGWDFRGVRDPEMAAFRTITGDEESATAVFCAVQRREYKESEKLNTRSHLHKNALTVFLDAVEQFLVKNPLGDGTFHITIESVDSKERLRIRFKQAIAEGASVWVYPNPPLHASLTTDSGPYGFEAELNEIADVKKYPSIEKHLRNRANRRNQLLYATTAGMPSLEGDLLPFLEHQRRSIFRNLGLFLMVDPYPDKQLFVQQGLQAFLRMLNILPADIEFE